MRRYIGFLFFIIIPFLSLLTGCMDQKDIVYDSEVYSFVGQVETPGSGKGLAITDTLVIVADNETGLTMISIKDKTAPSIVSVHRTILFPFGVDLIPTEHVALVAEGSGNVGVYSYENPDSLFIFLTIGSESAQDVIFTQLFVPSITDTAESMFLFIADRNSDLLGYLLRPGVDMFGNLAWSADPIGQVNSAGTGRGIDFVDGYIYLASGEWGLHILDARDPLNIIAIGGEFGGMDTNGYARDVEVHGDIAYLADDQKGLQIIDISNKDSLAILANVDTRTSLIDLAVSEDGNRVFTATTTSGLYIFDVSDPTDPKVIQRYDTPNARAVETDGDYVYVIDQYDGLIILKEN
ncbi:MAG: hypothetical protein B6244_12695 [Candidatus Cloacimonetes bacterium 4572_55]|nr:MAG: hypothetical protein B6244_12695 [Candidatus Cloacimonetes bacterium 4572_55]